MKNVWIEKEVFDDEMNIHGFVDIIIEEDDGSIYIYDVKSMNAWSYKFKFSKKYNNDNSNHHEMQLATYGVCVKKEFKRLDGMYMVYYNKDTSMIKEVEVSMDYLTTAKSFWETKVEQHKSFPPLIEGISPVKKLECGYCSYKDKCDNEKR